MSLVETAARAGFIPKGDRQAFINRLTEDPPRYPHLLDPHPEELRLQGDVYTSFPFVKIKADGSPTIKPHTCLVLNNTCDLQPQRSRSCNVALASDYASYAESIRSSHPKAKAEGLLTSVEKNKVDNLLFLAASPTFPDGIIVFLSEIATMPFRLFEESLAEGRRSASLSQDGFYFFLIKLTRFLARAESPDATRQQDATI